MAPNKGSFLKLATQSRIANLPKCQKAKPVDLPLQEEPNSFVKEENTVPPFPVHLENIIEGRRVVEILLLAKELYRCKFCQQTPLFLHNIEQEHQGVNNIFSHFLYLIFFS